MSSKGKEKEGKHTGTIAHKTSCSKNIFFFLLRIVIFMRDLGLFASGKDIEKLDTLFIPIKEEKIQKLNG